MFDRPQQTDRIHRNTYDEGSMFLKSDAAFQSEIQTVTQMPRLS
tara:strand:- start:168 stop:299 length:132 start_codon:yes stop_codon:yes gene_type:complete